MYFAFRSVEDRAVTATLMGSDIGDKNHSRDVPARLIRIFDKLVISDIWDNINATEKILGFPLGIGITADKDTSHHRSRQVWVFTL